VVKPFHPDGEASPPADTDSQPRIDEASQQLALKLKLTSVVLGCSTYKELCARFAACNRATLFVPQNAYKWLSGKAMPRASSVYEDWARVLGGVLGAPFLASSSFGEFQDEICVHFAVPETALLELRAEAGLTSAPALTVVASAPAMQSRPQPGGHWLQGTYLAISPAWSHVEPGRLITGAVRIYADPMQRLQISYSENLFQQEVVMTGQLLSDGRSAQSALTCSYTHRLFFLALNVPTPPANLISGILSGAAVHDPNARAAACRILLLRVSDDRSEEMLARAGYITADAEQVGDELAALGYRDGAARTALGMGIVDFLCAPSSSSVCDSGRNDVGRLEFLINQVARPEMQQNASAWR
jgi:hypothetical protein